MCEIKNLFTTYPRKRNTGKNSNLILETKFGNSSKIDINMNSESYQDSFCRGRYSVWGSQLRMCGDPGGFNSVTTELLSDMPSPLAVCCYHRLLQNYSFRLRVPEAWSAGAPEGGLLLTAFPAVLDSTGSQPMLSTEFCMEFNIQGWISSLSIKLC